MNHIKVLFVGWEAYPKDTSVDQDLRCFQPKYIPIVVNTAANAFHELAKAHYLDPPGNAIRAIVFNRKFVVENKGMCQVMVEVASRFSVHLKAVSFVTHAQDSKGKAAAPTDLYVQEKRWDLLKLLLDAQKLHN